MAVVNHSSTSGGWLSPDIQPSCEASIREVTGKSQNYGGMSLKIGKVCRSRKYELDDQHQTRRPVHLREERELRHGGLSKEKLIGHDSRSLTSPDD
jgi:hypothetical protein